MKRWVLELKGKQNPCHLYADVLSRSTVTLLTELVFPPPLTPAEGTAGPPARHFLLGHQVLRSSFKSLLREKEVGWQKNKSLFCVVQLTGQIMYITLFIGRAS